VDLQLKLRVFPWLFLSLSQLCAHVPGIAGGTVLGQARAVFQAFQPCKTVNFKVAFPKLKFRESLFSLELS
jgi:hypothetical protein